MKTNLIGLAVAAATLFSFAAFADDRRHHSAAPVAPAGAHGRYEQQSIQKWIPARYEQVTVQQCVDRRHGRGNRHWNAKRCYPVTQNRLVPGYYTTVQEWVWVPRHQDHQYSRRGPNHRPAPGHVGFRIDIR